MKRLSACLTFVLPLALAAPALAQTADASAKAPAPESTATPAVAPAAPPSPTPPPAVTTSAATTAPAPSTPAPPPTPPAVGLIPPMPANTVSCVFDNLSVEDREITLMLIGLDFINLGRYGRTAPDNPIVDRLVLEAVPRCAQAYRWSPAASAMAVEYAHFMLVREVVRQSLDFEDRKVEPIESFYAKNRSALVGKTELDDYLEEGFATHLIKAGWAETDREARRLARVYLETMIAGDRLTRDFTKATGPARAPARPRVRPARTASRGTP